ncbi:MAG: LytTR family transcriptional regulator DNA-binding domain-containing protein [Tannerellaceae bacterium]|jgi:hypothetical protein|nr:LytTR family transcriptional regulator DNA-binding domain-containing protein [Tannerellaceae bacterium]
MQQNPLFTSRRTLVGSLLLYISTLAAQAALLAFYGEPGILIAFVDAGIFISLLAAGGIATFFFFAYLRVWQAQAVASFTIIVLCLCVCFAAVVLAGLESVEGFLCTLPLRLLCGIASWTILMLWYRIRIYASEQQSKEELSVIAPAVAPSVIPQVEYLDRISVKDTGRINIVPIKDVLYILACGDYVTLVTPAGQFIKEQTMKYFDTHLPPGAFVRIHRSTIVNTEQILRVELFGKDNYNVRLKNGDNLRASLAGYRLLKERLNL